MDVGFAERHTGLQKRLRRLLQQTQHTTQGLEQARQLGRQASVHFAGQVKQHRHGLAGAKVFVHRGLKALGMRLEPIDAGQCSGRYRCQRGVQTLQGVAGIVQMHIAVVQGAAVVAAHHKKADGLGVKHLEHIADGEKVAQAFGHFFVVHIDEAVVHPVAGQGLAGCALALGNFVFMVGKLQIRPAAVDVKGLAQQLTRHGRAFDVPPGSPRPKGAGPFGFFGLLRFGALPQHKVQRVLLAVEHGDTLAGMQLVQRLARELAVARKFAHRKIHITIGHPVSQALAFELTNQAGHLRHKVGGTRFVLGPLDAQRIGVLVQGVNHALGQGPQGLAVVHRALDDFVVDVGDVAHIFDLVAAGFEPALHHIKGHHGAGVAQVAQVVDRHAAHIHAHHTRRDRRKGFHRPGERVVNAKGHGSG